MMPGLGAYSARNYDNGSPHSMDAPRLQLNEFDFPQFEPSTSPVQYDRPPVTYHDESKQNQHGSYDYY